MIGLKGSDKSVAKPGGVSMKEAVFRSVDDLNAISRL